VFLPVQVQILLSITSVAVQGFLRAGYTSYNCYFINTTGGVALPTLQSGQGSRNKSKNRDKLITPTVRVSKKCCLFFVMQEMS